MWPRMAHLEERPAPLCGLHHVGRSRSCCVGGHGDYDLRKEKKGKEDEGGEGGGGEVEGAGGRREG